MLRTPYLPGGLFLPDGNVVPDFVVEGSVVAGVPFAIDLFGFPAVVHVEAPPRTALTLDLRRQAVSIGVMELDVERLQTAQNRGADAAGRHPFGSCLDQQTKNSEPSFLGECGEGNYGGI